tara:strand:+ start:361 stop:1338 length:978 start_codon:yes stop_codon:yes gene_type:complete
MLHGVLEGSIRLGYQAMPLEIQPAANIRPREHKDGLLSKIDQFRPHFIFCHAIFDEGKESVWGILEVLQHARKKWGTKVFYHMGDPRYEPRFADDISDWVDMGLFNVKGYKADNNADIDLLSKFSKLWKIPNCYWPFGCWHINERPKPKGATVYDTIFTGHMSTHPRYRARTTFIEDCVKNPILKTVIANTEEGSHTHFFNSDLVAKSKAVIGYTAKVDRLDMFLDARSFIFGGYGALIFQKETKGAETVFNNMHHLVFFKHDDNEALSNLYEHYVLKNPQLGEEIRENIFKYVQKNHNYKNRVQDAIDVFSGKKERCRYLLEDF